MTNVKKTKANPKPENVRKPFLTGNITDENTAKSALAFFGSLIVVFFISFIACASASAGSLILRLVINTAVIAVIVLVFYNNGSKKGADAVARGEILYQRKEKGLEFSESERRICFHPAKGFMTGFIGAIPFLILAVILAICTSPQMTQAGTLPSWMQAYTRRSDIGNALVNYTQPEGMNYLDYIRAAIRICILPFVNIIGASNRNGILLLERISPLIILILPLSYGAGYLSGKKIRTNIHTAISENDRNRIRKEKKKAAQKRKAARPHEPEQLN